TAHPINSLSRRASVAWLARHRLTTLGAVVVGSLAISGWLIFGTSVGARTIEGDRDPKDLVVLPFANLGPAEDGYFAAGMTEEIAARLGTVGRLRLIASARSSQRNREQTPGAIGKGLGADYGLGGSARRQKSTQWPPRVRVTRELVS